MTQQRFNQSYIGLRGDVLSLIPRSSQKVLDVGCSTGTLGEQIKQTIQAYVVGIELDPAMAKAAADKLDLVITGNVETLHPGDIWPAESFDCIIFADILEHLRDPWEVLRRYTQVLQPNGSVVASIPNIGHLSAIGSLLVHRDWPRRDRGIFDRTHLRFFTLRTIIELFNSAGLEIELVRRNYRLADHGRWLNRGSKYWRLPPLLREYFTYQYLVVGQKHASGAGVQ